MSRTVLDYDAAHTFVEQQTTLGNDVRWEGWDIVFFNKTGHGFTNVDGAYRKGAWGMEKRISPSVQGTWSIPKKNIWGVR